jgi:xylan 1,4-beta-xylosidase
MRARTPVATLATSLVFGFAPAVWAQTPAQVTIAVDATGAGTPLERVWPNYGYDECNNTTTAEDKDLLSTVATANNAPVHIRTHFLLNTGDGTPSLKWGSTNAYTQDTAGNPVYSWTILDGIMDAITGAGAFPEVEIAFMPQALTSAPAGTSYKNSGTYNLDSASFYPPTDYTKWRALIDAWARHTQSRYPNAESTWLWELWNEPNIGYWNGNAADYAKLYDYTEAALHGVFPNALLGGPEVAGPGTFLTQFLQHCATGTNAVSGRTGTRLDLVTFHAKGGTALAGTDNHVEMDMGNQLRQHRDAFTTIAGMAQFKSTPIIIGEADPDGCAACPVSMNAADAYRNSPAYGAYEVSMMKRTLELEARLGVNVRGLLTWAFTFPGTPYFAGYRALATNGIHLPVLNDFKLLGQLSGMRMPVTSSGARTLDDVLANGVRGTADVDAMATRDGMQVQVLAWNYHDDLVTVAATPVHMTVQLPAGFGANAIVSHLRVDDSHGDAYTVWVSQGSPAAPSATQRAALVAAMQPAALQPQATVAATGGTLALDFTLPRFGVSLVTIQPTVPDGGGDAGTVSGAGGATGTTDAATGTDAARPPAGAGGSGAGGSGTASGGASGTTGGGAGGGGVPGASMSKSGCGCGIAPARPGLTGAIVALALAAGLVARRRRAR